LAGHPKPGVFAKRFDIDGQASRRQGVDRMSEMSSMLCIVLYRDAPSHHEPN